MKKYFSLASVVLAFSLVGAGCGSSGSMTSDVSPSPSSPAQGNSEARGEVATNSNCFNLYFPLKAGSSIDYMMDSGATHVPLTIKVAEHDADSIKLDYTFSVKGEPTTVTNELVCDNGSIHGTGYFDFASKLAGLDIRYETVKMEGEIIPSDLSVGREWTLDTEVIVHTNDARMQAILNGKHQTSHVVSRVVGEEDVTVPAGTFHALKIHQDISVDTGIQGAAVQTQGDAWYVKDIGLVKSQNSIGGQVSGMQATKITE